MRIRALVVAASIGLLAVAGAQAMVARGTLHGVVTRGPITPVCVAEQPCDAPAKNVTLLFVRNGRVVGRTVTGDDGRYRLRLPAGSYLVRRALASGAERRLTPSEALVRAGQSIRIDFHIDTGIR